MNVEQETQTVEQEQGPHLAETQVIEERIHGIEQSLLDLFESLPPDTKSLISTFFCLQASEGIAGNSFALPRQLRGVVGNIPPGPIESEWPEVAWAKGVADGIFLMYQHS